MKKLLVVNLHEPNKTQYLDPLKVHLFMWGKRLVDLALFSVNENLKMEEIVILSADVFEIQNTVLRKLK
jgi:hypothetical protein